MKGFPLTTHAKTFIQEAARPVAVAALLITLFMARSTPLAGPPAYLVPASIGTLMLTLLWSGVRNAYKEGWGLAFIVVASIRVVAEVLAIAVFGAGINAVALDPLSSFVGFISFIPLALAIEASRVYIIRKGGNNAATVMGSAALMTLVIIPFPRLAQLAGPPAIAWSYMTRSLIPAFANNLILSELAAWWGFRASATYSLLMWGMYSISPIMPNTPWFATAIFAVTVAVIQSFSIIPAGPLKERVREARARRRVRRGRSVVDKVITAAAITILGLALAGFALGYRAMVVVSGSMEPEIRVGDVVVSAPNTDGVEVGDIVAYATPQGIIVHRVVSKEVKDGELVYRTKGDANNAVDPWVVPKESIIGEVTAIIPYVGYPMYLIASALGGFAQATTALITAFLLTFYVYNRFIGGDLV